MHILYSLEYDYIMKTISKYSSSPCTSVSKFASMYESIDTCLKRNAKDTRNIHQIVILSTHVSSSYNTNNRNTCKINDILMSKAAKQVICSADTITHLVPTQEQTKMHTKPKPAANLYQRSARMRRTGTYLQCTSSPVYFPTRRWKSCGIIGLPNVGKSTLFNALTRTQVAEAANYPFCTGEWRESKLLNYHLLYT